MKLSRETDMCRSSNGNAGRQRKRCKYSLHPLCMVFERKIKIKNQENCLLWPFSSPVFYEVPANISGQSSIHSTQFINP